jgi:hypothetical protein
MGSNWAEEFRRRIEESEGKHRPTEKLDDADEEDWEEKEEEDVELEESEEDEAEEEIEEVEQENKDEEEAEEVPEEAGKPEAERFPLKPVQTPKLPLERQRFRQELADVLGSTTIQPAKTEVTKAEPVKPVKRETNEWAGVGAAMMGLMVLSLMPTLYKWIRQAFQPLIQSLQDFSSRSQGTLAAGQEWVSCPYCGYQCLGYNSMPCPRCGRS